MAIFAIIPTTTDPNKLNQAITAKLGPKALQLPHGEWLASYDGTSKSLSDVLGITDGTNGSALVVSMAGYWGRAPNNVWEFILQNWGVPSP